MKRKNTNRIVATMLATSLATTVAQPVANAQGLDILGGITGGLFGGGGSSGGGAAPSSSSTQENKKGIAAAAADKQAEAEAAGVGDEANKEGSQSLEKKKFNEGAPQEGDFNPKGEGKVIVNMNITGKGGGSLPIQLIQDGAVVAESVTDGRGRAKMATPTIGIGDFEFSLATPTGTDLKNARCTTNGGYDSQASKEATLEKQREALAFNESKQEELKEELAEIEKTYNRAKKAEEEFKSAKDRMFSADETDWTNFYFPTGAALAERYKYIKPNAGAPSVLFTETDDEGNVTDQSVEGEETGEETSGEESSGEETSGEESSGEETSGEESSGEETSGEESSGEETSEEEPKDEEVAIKKLGSNITDTMTVNPPVLEKIYLGAVSKIINNEESGSSASGVREKYKDKGFEELFGGDSAKAQEKYDEILPPGSQERAVAESLLSAKNEKELKQKILSWFDSGSNASSFGGDKIELLNDFARRALLNDIDPYDTPVPWEIFKTALSETQLSLQAPTMELDPTIIAGGGNEKWDQVKDRSELKDVIKFAKLYDIHHNPFGLGWGTYGDADYKRNMPKDGFGTRMVAFKYGDGYKDIEDKFGIMDALIGSRKTGANQNDYATTHYYMKLGTRSDYLKRWKYITEEIMPRTWNILDEATGGAMAEVAGAFTGFVNNLGQGLSGAGPLLGMIPGVGQATGAVAAVAPAIAGMVDTVVNGATRAEEKKIAKNALRVLTNHYAYAKWFEKEIGIGDKVASDSINKAVEQYKKKAEDIDLKEVPTFIMKKQEKPMPANAGADGNLLSFSSSTGSEVNCSATLMSAEVEKDDLNTGINRNPAPTVIQAGGGSGSGLSKEDLKEIFDANNRMIDKALNGREMNINLGEEGSGVDPKLSRRTTDDISRASGAIERAANEAARAAQTVSKATALNGPKVDTGGSVDNSFFSRVKSIFS